MNIHPRLRLNNPRNGPAQWRTHRQNALPDGIKSLASVGMARVKPTFIGKQNQIPISTSEVQVTAAPIPSCRSMTSGENSTEVESARTYRLNVLSPPISDSRWMNTMDTVFRLLLQSDACYVAAARRYSNHRQQWSHVAYHFEDGFLWHCIVAVNAR